METESQTGARAHVDVPGPIYLAVALTIAVLTLFGVGVAYTHGAPPVLMAVLLLVLAAVGVALEVLYYMHLKTSPKRRLYTLFFGSGLLVAVFMAAVLTVLLELVIPASAAH